MTSCSVPDIPDKDVSGDNLYGPRICDQPFIDWAWPAYKFNSDYWRHGFGFEDVCNTDLPTARTLSAIWLLNYSADDYMNEEWSSSCLHWACRYVREQVGDLRAKCSNGTYIAYAFGGHIELYLGCFYSKSVPGRAETGARVSPPRRQVARCQFPQLVGVWTRKTWRRFHMGLRGRVDVWRVVFVVVLRRRRAYNAGHKRGRAPARAIRHRQCVRYPSRICDLTARASRSISIPVPSGVRYRRPASFTCSYVCDRRLIRASPRICCIPCAAQGS